LAGSLSPPPHAFKPRVTTNKAGYQREVMLYLQMPVARKLNFAYALGHVGQVAFGDLKLLIKTRNAFAHTHGRICFNDQVITDMLGKLQTPKRLFESHGIKFKRVMGE